MTKHDKSNSTVVAAMPQDRGPAVSKKQSEYSFLRFLLLFILPVGTSIFLYYAFSRTQQVVDHVPNLVVDDVLDTHAMQGSTGTGTPGNAPNDSIGVMFHVLRNGETDVCGNVPFLGVGTVKDAAYAMFPSLSKNGLGSMTKYQLDAVLTYIVSLAQDGSDQCGIAPNPMSGKGRMAKQWQDWFERASARPMNSGFLKFCDMVEGERLTIQTDHEKLEKVPASFAGVDTFPCHFHTKEGLRITSFDQLITKVKEIHDNLEQCKENGNYHDSCKRTELSLHAVPAGRVFMFASSYVGEIIELDHIENPLGNRVYLETLSLSPRVFEIHNFFTVDEADRIVHNAVTMTADTHKFKRSSTGASGYNLNPTRTSENAFDTHSTEAQSVKRRCIKALGFDEYEEGVTDGLQVLRYNKTTAYVDHLDYIEDYQKLQEHNFDSMHLGSNRFGTILLYFNDLSNNVGGQTVFTKAWPKGISKSDQVSLSQAISDAREAGATALFNQGSWEERMVAMCRTKLAVTPARAKAVLFYSQFPDGQVDPASIHGACPILGDESKLAANLWVWNAPRPDFPGAPFNDWVKEKDIQKKTEENGQLTAVFENTGVNSEYDNAQLYFQDTYWSELGKNSAPMRVNTYKGHEWHVKVNGEKVMSFKVRGQKFQTFTI